MEKNKKNINSPAGKVNTTNNDKINNATSNNQNMALDDEQRVKVLSPTMLVVKRFVRNKLAIIGAVIILAMFLFAFLGGIVSPYSESQVFMGYEKMSKEYASVTLNKELRYTVKEGKELPSAAKAALILAVNKGETSFETMGVKYSLIKEGENFYRIVNLDPVATATVLRGIVTITVPEGNSLTSDLESAFRTAIKDGESSVVANNVTYMISQNGKEYVLGTVDEIAFASTETFDVYEKGTELSHDFKLAAELAVQNNERSFSLDGVEYSIESENETAIISRVDGINKVPYANVSNFLVQSISNDVFLDVTFKTLIEEAISNGESTAVGTDANGEEVVYTITRKNDQYTVKADLETQKIMIYDTPSKSHWLGTDANGMDILTRLMYGGRISLMIGFIVVIIEAVLGVVLGGIAGYFGKWVDNLIMRIVDIFYCIPSMPLIIIIGAIMDSMKIDPQIRIYFLMLIMGILGWPQIARLVRGQILSLREQEFMTATEALGISVPRRIFKHLIPNVIPQLIVMLTMGLGSIILTESTLSFLGIGVKFPFASWGNIISAVTNVYVMTNYWFVWIPAGICILLTVLAFNFIGDGLRDAFDPKMKR